MDKKYLGCGMKFPIQVNPATGRVVVSNEEMSVKESIYLILMTEKSERLARPNFGSKLNSYTFMDLNYTRINMVRRELKEMILSQEPRIEDVDIDIEDQTNVGRLVFNINYTIADGHRKDSLVFPFYLDKGVDETEQYTEDFADTKIYDNEEHIIAEE